MVCFTALVYTNRSLPALLLLLLLLCLPAAANFYIVVSQDVVTAAVVLDVGFCLLFPLRHQHIMCFDLKE